MPWNGPGEAQPDPEEPRVPVVPGGQSRGSRPSRSRTCTWTPSNRAGLGAGSPRTSIPKTLPAGLAVRRGDRPDHGHLQRPGSEGVSRRYAARHRQDRVEESVLNKPTSRSTRRSFLEIYYHPAISAKILSPILRDTDILGYVKHHHEYWDGSRPDRLKGEAIPIGATILSVADAFDAITSDRPSYRSARPVSYAPSRRSSVPAPSSTRTSCRPS